MVGARAAIGALFLLGVAASGPARADHGGTLQLNGDPAGPYRVSVWTQPTPPQRGALTVTVAVMRPENFRPVADVAVEVTAEPLQPGAAGTTVRAVKGPEAWAGYAAELPIPRAGSWKVTVRVTGRDGAGSAEFPLEVAGRSAGGWLWAGAGAVVLGVGVGWWARRRRRALGAVAVVLILLALLPGLAALAQVPAPRPSARITMEELHRHGGVPPGWRFGLPGGDARAGREVFVKLECHKCHAVRGEMFPGGGAREGTAVGPDLTGMGAHHPAEYLAESILDPNAVVVIGPGFTGPDGRSIMPDYRDTLTVTELIDLVAYLKSLTGGAPHGAAGAPAREQVAGSYRVRLDYHAHNSQAGHLMVFVSERETGEPVPYLPISVTLHAGGGTPRRVALAPMMGDRGFHYGADVGVPGNTTRVTVSIGRPTIRVMPSAASRFAAPREVSFEWSAATPPGASGGHGDGHRH